MSTGPDEPQERIDPNATTQIEAAHERPVEEDVRRARHTMGRLRRAVRLPGVRVLGKCQLEQLRRQIERQGHGRPTARKLKGVEHPTQLVP